MPETILLIPHYNNLTGLSKSIQSVYHPRHLKILVVDDGSHAHFKPVHADLKKLLNRNIELDILYLQENRGITKTLNAGLKYILSSEEQYSFIARLDCGDLAVSNRFLLQENFLMKHRKVDLVGSWVKFNNEHNEYLFSVTPPVNHRSIRRKMSIRCSFIHPAVMYRRSMVENLGMYPEYEAAEDYAYFFDAVHKTKTANIPGFLTIVEMNRGGISSRKRFIQNVNKLRIINRFSEKNVYYFMGVAYTLGLICMPDKLVRHTKRLLLR